MIVSLQCLPRAFEGEVCSEITSAAILMKFQKNAEIDYRQRNSIQFETIYANIYSVFAYLWFFIAWRSIPTQMKCKRFLISRPTPIKPKRKS
jgi:hypothetical protein